MTIYFYTLNLKFVLAVHVFISPSITFNWLCQGYLVIVVNFTYLCLPLKKEGHIALHMSVSMSVCMSVSLNLVQLITQECFAQKASNFVVR